MRLLRLDLIAFGPFEGASLDLDAGGPALHVIHGPNEAGKSTTRRAVAGLLFGIPERTKDDHRHRMPKLKIGAELLAADGSRLVLVRKKGRKNTLADKDGAPVDEALLRRLLRGVDQQRFESVFSLDATSLRSGAEALLEGHGDVGESLFDAGLGGRGSHAVLVGLEQEAKELFAPTGSVKPLNVALAALKDAQARCRALELSAAEDGRQEQGIAELSARLEQAKATRRALLAEKSGLERRLRVLPALRKRTELLEQRARIAHADALAALPVEELAWLGERLGAWLKAREDLPQREQDRRDAEERARVLLQSMGREPLPDGGDVVDVAVREHVRQLATERKAVEQRVERARRDRSKTEAERRGLKIELDGLPPQRSLAALRAAHKAALRLDADDVDRLARELDRKRAGVRSLLPELRPFQGDVAEAARLAVPSAAAVEEHLEAERALAGRVESLERDELDHARRERENARRLHEQRLVGAVPTEALLREARHERDERGAALRSAGGAASSADWEAYEASRRAADELADRMRQEADRVAAHAGLVAEEAALARESGELAVRRAALEHERAEARQRWLAAWQASALEPGSPREMSAWLRAHATLRGALGEVAAGDAALAERRAQLEQGERELREVLAAFADDDGHAATETLAVLVGRADELLEARQRLEQRRDELTRLLRDETALLELSADCDRAEAEQREWRRDWASCMERLGLASEAALDEAEALLGRLEQVAECLAERDRVQERIDHMTEDLRAFEDRARPLLAAALPGAAADPLDAQLRELLARQARVAAIDAGLREREQELAEHGDGASIDELIAATRDTDADAVRARIAELELELGTAAPRSRLVPGTEGAEEEPARVESLDDRIESLAQELKSAQDGLLRARQGSAAGAAEEAAFHFAEVAALARRWATLRLAARLLRDEIERYRQEHQGPLLLRAAELFPRLTCGAWEGLLAGPGDGELPVLRCRRRGGEEVGVEGLSQGTRDQLFLALRVASLERQAELDEPLPVILDDALVEFDDSQRLQAALGVLGELAVTTQVLYFTHHESHVALAQQAVPAERLRVHELLHPSTLSEGAGA